MPSGKAPTPGMIICLESTNSDGLVAILVLTPTNWSAWITLCILLIP